MLQVTRSFGLRMCPADQERYGGPESVVFRDTDELLDLPFAEVCEIEDAIGIPMLRLRTRIISGQLTAPVLRAMLWLARGRTDTWETFEPNVQRLEINLDVVEEADAVPPDPAGSTSETGEPATS